MLQSFKPDFWALAREQKGYYSWADRNRWRLAKKMRRLVDCGHLCCRDLESGEIVDALFNDGLGTHPLIDCVFEGLARAESRFSLRFVPQRSHEERLTGNLVSEIEAALFLIRPVFSELSQARYGKDLDVDFLYYDLSRGGMLEKQTGADLAFILAIDLPDLPYLVRYASFQAKKFNGSTSIQKDQFDTLIARFGDAAAYLFYDMNQTTLLPPMVIPASEFESKAKEKDHTQSLSVSEKHVESGLPLSLWLLTSMARGVGGKSARDFQDAMNHFTGANDRQCDQDGRLAILSIGKKLQTRIHPESGLDISLPE
ncbi:MAG: hypothetical protein HZA24_00410 [Nitrospirae bacterium]|nr:hypothetical protein [Nitrospirota bacterium]